MPINALQVFNNSEFRGRVFEDEQGVIWFVAKDVAEALDYSDASVSNMNKVIGMVPEQWKGRKRIPTLGGEQETLCLTEQGLYFFLGRSDKPKALPYQIWIADDVVPSIRKTGSYRLPQKVEPVVALGLADVVSAAKLLFETAGLEGNQLVLAIDRVSYRVLGFSMLKESGIQLVAPDQHQLITPTQIAELLQQRIPDQKFSNRRVNILLAEGGYQIKVGKNWEPTELGKINGAVLLDTGKAHSDGSPIRQLKWSSSIVSQLVNRINFEEDSQFC